MIKYTHRKNWLWPCCAPGVQGGAGHLCYPPSHNGSRRAANMKWTNEVFKLHQRLMEVEASKTDNKPVIYHIAASQSCLFRGLKFGVCSSGIFWRSINMAVSDNDLWLCRSCLVLLYKWGRTESRGHWKHKDFCLYFWDLNIKHKGW